MEDEDDDLYCVTNEPPDEIDWDDSNNYWDDGKEKRRLMDERDHEDYYDRYHNFPDDPEMALVPGSAAFRKRNGEDQAASRSLLVRQPEYDLENEPNGNVKPPWNENLNVDGNR